MKRIIDTFIKSLINLIKMTIIIDTFIKSLINLIKITRIIDTFIESLINLIKMTRIIDTFINSGTKVKRIPYSQIKNLKEIDSGGFAIIYEATWKKKKVAVKKFLNS